MTRGRWPGFADVQVETCTSFRSQTLRQMHQCQHIALLADRAYLCYEGVKQYYGCVVVLCHMNRPFYDSLICTISL